MNRPYKAPNPPSNAGGCERRTVNGRESRASPYNARVRPKANVGSPGEFEEDTRSSPDNLVSLGTLLGDDSIIDGTPSEHDTSDNDDETGGSASEYDQTNGSDNEYDKTNGSDEAEELESDSDPTYYIVEACPNRCICYEGSHANVTECPGCNEPRYDKKGRPRYALLFPPPNAAALADYTVEENFWAFQVNGAHPYRNMPAPHPGQWLVYDRPRIFGW